MSEVFEGWTPLQQFADECLRKSDGSTRSKRSVQTIVRKYDVPIIQIGHTQYANKKLWFERLQAAQLAEDSAPRRPRRPIIRSKG